MLWSSTDQFNTQFKALLKNVGIPQNNDERKAFLKEFFICFVTPKEKMA